MFGRQWNTGPMGGLIGWGGYDAALSLLVHGFEITGGELIAEVERLRLFEDAQMEIDAQRRAYEKKTKKKQGQREEEAAEHVQGDLDDFYYDDEREGP